MSESSQLNESNIGEIFLYAAKSGASDLHLMSNMIPRLRTDGQLIPVIAWGKVSHEELDGIVKSLIARDGIQQLEEHGNVDGSYQVGNARFRLNISYVFDYENKNSKGLQVSARILANTIPPLENIGLGKSITEEIIALERGIVLVTGVTGSGKSTTLAAILNEINHQHLKSIITLEQPIEYLFVSDKSYIRQREIPLSTHTFATGVRESLRQDPDIIFVGEIRDVETANAALQAADSGHLLFSTLHTGSAVETISRLADWYPPESQAKLRSDLASNLQYVISQQLLPKKEGKGRVLAAEIFKTSHAARNLIIERKEQQKLEGYLQAQRKLGCVLMDDSLIALYQAGAISGETAIARAYHPDTLRSAIMNTHE